MTENHLCEISDLDYLYASDKRLYRVICKVCTRHWDLSLVPAREGNGKLVGYWRCSAIPPRPLFPMKEWWELTRNEIPPIKTPEDIRFMANKRTERLAAEDTLEFQFQKWKKETGGLRQWDARIS